MDIIWTFMSAIIMAIIGYLTTIAFKINVAKILSDLSAISLFVVPLLIFLITAPRGDVEASTNFLTDYITILVNALPGAIIGDVVGTLAAGIKRNVRNI